MTPGTPPDWYVDPSEPAQLRWWDGQGWTSRVRGLPQAPTPAPSTAPPTPARPPAPDPPAAPSPPVAAPPAPPVTAPHAPLAPPPAVPGRPGGPRKVGLFGARAAVRDLAAENDQLRAALESVGALDYAQVHRLLAAARTDLVAVRAEVGAAARDLAALRAQLLDVRATADAQDFGLYDFDHPARASAALAADLVALRARIKDCVTNKRATSATPGFVFNDSPAKGRTFIEQMSKMMLAAYNAEAENAIKTVKAGNLQAAQTRLYKAVERVAKNGQMIALAITPEYHQLRTYELELAARHLMAVDVAREVERAHREELREAKRAEEELRRQREKLEKERAHYANALTALQGRGDTAGAADLAARLHEIDESIANVDYRAANVRAGYVYVISNVGSLGEHIVKIGMTRRLDPMDRVRELSGASVPFNFDVHALFFADDAYGIEATLHRHFAAHRVNRVNLRREFFYTTPAAVLAALREHNVAVVEFRTDVEAAEFTTSTALATAAGTLT